MMDMAWLWDASVRGSGLILLALLFHSWKRAPRWAVSWLWTAAALRLLLPVNLVIPVQGQGISLPTVLTGQQENSSLARFLWVIWAAGTGWMLLCLVLQAWLAHRQIQDALPLEDCFCQQMIAEQRLRRPVRLLTCQQIGTPLTYGLLRPRILLPQQMDLTHRQGLACALTHELVHIRRLDALRKGFVRAALCLHWFNPLAWVLVLLSDQAMEQACDEKTLSLLGERQKGTYARALLRLAEQNSRSAPLHSGFGLTGQNGLEERIGLIMKYKNISHRTALAAALAVAAAATVSAAELKPMEPQVQVDSTRTSSVEVDGITAALSSKQQNGNQYMVATLDDGQQISYTLNSGHCSDGVTYSVNHHGHHNHYSHH